MVGLLTSSAVDRGFESRSSQTKNYEIGMCCFSAKHTTVKTFGRSSALFETAWVKSTAPFMVPWVRPNPEDMTKWVIHAEVVYIETISGDTNSYQIMGVTIYCMHDSFTTLWVRSGVEFMALWIRPYAQFMTQ